MLKQKVKIHHIPIALAVFLVVTASSFFALNILAQTINATTSTTVPLCTSHTCSDWSACSPSGTQTKICTPVPEGCLGDTITKSQSCTYIPPTCSYAYSGWSECAPNGTQIRTVVSKSPDGCQGASETTRTCNYTPPPCEYTYTGWGECSSSGMQYRDIKSYSPTGCVGGTVEELKRSCTYVSDQNSSTDSANASNDTVKIEENTNSEADSIGSAGTSNTSTNTIADQPSQSANTITGTQTNLPVDISWSVNDDWKKKYFGSNTCPETSCGGDADPDKDRLSNNDEVRYGTDPLNPDTDGDGKLDGDEVASGSDPLKYPKTEEEDKIIFESPKEAGEIKADVYKVTNIEMVALENGAKQMKITGKGPANSYVNVYIYSGDSIIVTVKTDSNGDWTYNVDRELDDGNHEVYVAVTNNSGAIKAKSEPLPFVKTAQAVSVAQAGENNVVAPAAKAGISVKKVFYILAFGFFAVVLAFILLGVVIKKLASKIKLN